MRLEALITGANGGIGVALCNTFKNAGWHVTGTDIHASAKARCDRYVATDLARFAADPAYRAERLGALRGTSSRLDALVNNAAVQIVGPMEKLTAEDWLQTSSVNVISPFLLAQGLLRELEAAGGAVVNIASIHAQQTKAGFSAYATSKAALVGLTRALAVELGGRVRVNAVSPAAVSTPMLASGFERDPQGLARLASHHPSGAIGSPEDVAQFVLALASPGSKYVTGAVLNLDGAISSRLHDPN